MFFLDPRGVPQHGLETGSSWADWLFPLIVIALLATIVGLLIYALSTRPAPTVVVDDGDPTQRAALRLASGEITLREFDEIRDRTREQEADGSTDDGDG